MVHVRRAEDADPSCRRLMAQVDPDWEDEIREAEAEEAKEVDSPADERSGKRRKGVWNSLVPSI